MVAGAAGCAPADGVTAEAVEGAVQTRTDCALTTVPSASPLSNSIAHGYPSPAYPPHECPGMARQSHNQQPARDVPCRTALGPLVL